MILLILFRHVVELPAKIQPLLDYIWNISIDWERERDCKEWQLSSACKYLCATFSCYTHYTYHGHHQVYWTQFAGVDFMNSFLDNVKRRPQVGIECPALTNQLKDNKT